MTDIKIESQKQAETEEIDVSQSQHVDGSSSSVSSTQDSEIIEDDSMVQPGDHIYQWKSFAGIPSMVQHHGIVIKCENSGETMSWTVVDFEVLLEEYTTTKRDEQQTAPARVCCKTLIRKRPNSNTLVEQSEPRNHWHKVQYEAPFWRRHFVNRSGTCTSVKPDPTGLILARVEFLLQHPTTLPPKHFLKCNSECVAVWCMTNTWATLQTSSFLELTAAGQIKSATTLAMAASSTQVTVPAAGVWGWLGFTTKVSLLSTQPWLVPALAGYGILSVGGPVWMLSKCRVTWNETCTKLNDAFWEFALDNPDQFAQQLMTEWSAM